MNNCAIYCRVSSKEQVEGTSLEVQEMACRDYAATRGIEVKRVFLEQGESAKFADRTQLLELINYCQANKGEIQVLLVWKVDRFARNVADHYSVKATLAKSGVSVVSVTEPIDSNPEGKLLETILAGFAEFDNSLRAMRSVHGMRRKIQEGIFPWGAPYGYKSSVTNREKKIRPDTPDPELFPLLRKAWTVFAEGAYSQSEIGRMMQSWGLRSAKGLKFSPQSLRQFFSNPYYRGCLTDPWSGQEYPGLHIPLVSPEEFARVQLVLVRRGRSLPHQKLRPEFPLRGVVRCPGCRHYMTASYARGRYRTYPYYHCQHKQCIRYGKSWKAPEIHEGFSALLERLTPKAEALAKLNDEIITRAERRLALVQQVNNRRKSQAAKLDREADALVQMRIQGLLTDQEFLIQKRRIADRKHATLVEASNEINLGRIRASMSAVMRPLTQLRQTWENLNPHQRQRFHKIFLPVGFVLGEYGTTTTCAVLRAVQSNSAESSLEVPPVSALSNQIIQELQELSQLFGTPEACDGHLPAAA